MKEPNWENLLRNWTPRPPSGEVREKIFCAATRSSADGLERPHFKWNWLTPAAIGAFTLFMVAGIHPHLDNHFATADTNLFFAGMTMNSMTSQNAGMFSTATFALSKHDLNLEQNVWREASFASTNYTRTRSSMPSLPVWKTNSLIR